MRRLVALFTVVMLVAALGMPVAAAAKGGPPADKGPAHAPGQLKKAAPPEAPVVIEDAPEAVAADPGSPVPSAGIAEGADEAEESVPAAGKSRGLQQAAEAQARATERVRERAEVRSQEPMAAAESENDTDTVVPDDEGDDGASEDPTDEASGEGKRLGIANALSRIMSNIARAEARVESGTQSHVPGGLLKVMSKFLGWLGIDVDTDQPSDEDPAPGDPGEDIDDDGGTDGSEEETVTPEPPGSDEETDTVYPPVEE